MIEALSDEHVVRSNSVAIVTRNWIILPDADSHSQTILAISRVEDLKIIRTTYPGLIVIAAALFLLAAAAFSSKEGNGAGLPIALVGFFFLVGYIGSRRACVAFTVGKETAYSINGSPSEASAVVKAVHSAQARLTTAPSDESRLAS